jgi:pSer/pThr/pTyr-binding forkhead associated (FHA) protein
MAKVKVTVKLGDRVIDEASILKSEVAIGRNAENDIVLNNLAVSNFHSRIFKEGKQYFLQDLGSLNGTFVGGRKVELHELSIGEEISIGKYTLVFNEEDVAFPAAKDKSVSPLALEQTMMFDIRQLEERGIPVPPPGGKAGILVVEKGNAECPEFNITTTNASIGKGNDADFHIRGFFVPDIAARVHRTPEGYFVSPPESGKKPKLNGERLAVRVKLSEGDVITAGGVGLRFNLRDAK